MEKHIDYVDDSGADEFFGNDANDDESMGNR